MSRTFAVVAPGTRLAWMLPGVSLLAGVVGIALAMRETPIATLALLPLALGAVLVGVTLTRRRVELENGELRIAAGLNSRRIDVSKLQLDQAAIIDLTKRRELRPFWRTFGTGLPGYRAGHYRLRNGTRAFVLVTDTRRVLALPEQDGRMVLLSLAQPQALLDAIAGRTAR